MNEELKNGLDALKTELKGKTEQEVKTAIDNFEAKFNDVVAKEVKGVKEAFETELKAVKDHANKLDVRLQEKAKSEGLTELEYMQKYGAFEIEKGRDNLPSDRG